MVKEFAFLKSNGIQVICSLNWLTKVGEENLLPYVVMYDDIILTCIDSIII